LAISPAFPAVPLATVHVEISLSRRLIRRKQILRYPDRVPDRLFHCEDDWYEWRQRPALSAEVFVRVAGRHDGRLGITELRIVGEPSSELLRSIPVGRIEAAANAQLTVLDDAVTPAPRRRRRRAVATATAPKAASTTTSARPDNDKGWEQPSASRTRGRPDRFYADIAAAYLDLARSSRRPAADLAEDHDVPVTTVHRWIKEARRRGHLAPGRPGKAG
jgi:hypothetical protein